MKECPNCSVNLSSPSCDFCGYPAEGESKEITKFIARQSIIKVTITDSQRRSKISGQLTVVLALLKMGLVMAFNIVFPLKVIFLLEIVPTLYLILGIFAIRFPIPFISVSLVVYVVEKYYLYTTPFYQPGFLVILLSLAFFSVLIIGLIYGIKYERMKKKYPFLYAQISGEHTKIDEDIIG